MQLSHLKYFEETAKWSSMRKAAEHLYITQAALSSAIALLERELEVTLFERSPKGITLTLAGAEALQLAKNILALQDELLHLSQKKFICSGKFKISAFTSMVNTVLSDVVIQASRQYPALELLVETSNNIPQARPENDEHFCYIVCCEDRQKDQMIHTVQHLGWECEVIGKTESLIFLNAKHKLAQKDALELEDLENFYFANLQILNTDNNIKFSPHNDMKRFFKNKEHTFFTGESALNFIVKNKNFAGIFSYFLAQKNYYIEKNLIKAMHIRNYPMQACFCLCFPKKSIYSVSETTIHTLIRYQVKQYLPE